MATMKLVNLSSFSGPARLLIIANKKLLEGEALPGQQTDKLDLIKANDNSIFDSKRVCPMWLDGFPVNARPLPPPIVTLRCFIEPVCAAEKKFYRIGPSSS